MKIQKISLMVLPMLFAAGTALAQAPQSTIRESTDPARIAEVERRAEALRRGQATADTPAMRPGTRGERGHMHGDGRGHHHDGRGHHHGHRGMHGDHPKAAPGSGGPAR